jgi:hypothetical protein
LRINPLPFSWRAWFAIVVERANKRIALFAVPLDWLLDYYLARSVVFTMTINSFALSIVKEASRVLPPTLVP